MVLKYLYCYRSVRGIFKHGLFSKRIIKNTGFTTENNMCLCMYLPVHVKSDNIICMKNTHTDF